jgi:N-acetylmuramoyl-L-alanine amidase
MKKAVTLILLFLSAFLLTAVTEAQAASASITDLRWTTRTDASPHFVRIVMDLTGSVHAEAAIDDSGKNLEIVLKNTSMDDDIDSSYSMNKDIVKNVKVSEHGSDVYLDAALTKSHTMNDIKIFGLKPDSSAGKPHRLVIDIPESATSGSSSSSSSTSDGFKISDEAKKALKGKIICIDAGHGGTDVGAIGHLSSGDVYEKNVTLSIAKPLRDLLTEAGAKVLMTRSTDVDVAGPYSDAVTELQARCDVANNGNADAFVSIHIDSFTNSSVDGTTAYYYPKSDKDLLLAQMMHQANLKNLYIPDRGVRSNNFYVNVHTTMPSVLMEMGFITNDHRLKMLTSNWAPVSIARSLFDGLVSYFERV